MAGGQRGELFACRLVKNGSAPITSAACSQLDQSCEDRIEIAFAARVQDMELQPEGAGRRLHVSRYGLGIWDWSG